jgi:hypothetical protein
MRLRILAAIAAAAIASPALATDEASVIDYLKSHLEETDNTRVNIGFADLNGDGKDEAVVFVLGPYWCGSGGCNALVLTPEGDGWKQIAETSVSSLPIGMLDSQSNGWKDLTIAFSGGGLPAGIGQMKFDGETYPRNPTSAPEAKDIGTVIIAEDDEATEL